MKKYCYNSVMKGTVMNEKVLKTLEFNKILSQLEEYASSEAAKHM